MQATTKIHIRFADIDSLGHVNNAVYLSYFESARIDFFAKNFDNNWNWKEVGIVLVKNEVEYLRPIYLHDDIYIVTKVSKIGSKSMDFTYEVYRVSKDSDELCARGLSVIVAYDYVTGKSKLIPEVWRKAMQ